MSTRRSFFLSGIKPWALRVRSASDPEARRLEALRIREEAAKAQSAQPLPAQVSNGDEVSFPRHLAAFTKGLPHDQLGEVEPAAYESLLLALSSGKTEDFERIARGSGRRLVNPQAAFAYGLEGSDSHCFACPPAPSFGSSEGAAEMIELYWQALVRDVPFAEYEESNLIHQAADELKAASSTVFRGVADGDLEGPYISQFLWKPIPWGSGLLHQRYRVPVARTDFMTSVSEWVQIQSGVPPWREARFDETPRYIRNGRDLAEYVHYDFLYQAFLNAALILMNDTPESVFNERLYFSDGNPYRHSKVQEGFVTLGRGMVTDWLARVTTAALRAAWCQKWLVHRRLRPEEFAGRTHHTIAGTASYPIHPGVAASLAVRETRQLFGSALLPQAYPEGSPLHPAYPSGHATVSGACVTVLKALFDEDALVPDCVMASADGLSLAACPDWAPRVGMELNKLGTNVAMGRDFAGIHYRSDAHAGLRLGEQVAISMLRDLRETLPDQLGPFRFTSLDGAPVLA